MAEPVYAKRQHANLWGRAIGELNQKITDIDWKPDLDNSPVTVNFDIRETTNTLAIPDNAQIWLNVRWRLRMHRYYCGTKSNPTTPDDTEGGGNQITAFGDNLGEAKWELKFVDPVESGRVWAWTAPERILPREVALKDDFGHSLLSISTAPDGVLGTEAWAMDFNDTNPAILVNPTVPELREILKSKNQTSLLIIPEAVSHIIDEMIQNHCEIPIQAGTDGWQERWLTWAYARFESRLPSSVDSPEDMIRCLEWKAELIRKLKQIIDQAPMIRADLDGGDE